MKCTKCLHTILVVVVFGLTIKGYIDIVVFNLDRLFGSVFFVVGVVAVFCKFKTWVWARAILTMNIRMPNSFLFSCCFHFFRYIIYSFVHFDEPNRFRIWINFLRFTGTRIVLIWLEKNSSAIEFVFIKNTQNNHIEWMNEWMTRCCIANMCIGCKRVFYVWKNRHKIREQV